MEPCVQCTCMRTYMCEHLRVAQRYRTNKKFVYYLNNMKMVYARERERERDSVDGLFSKLSHAANYIQKLSQNVAIRTHSETIFAIPPATPLSLLALASYN